MRVECAYMVWMGVGEENGNRRCTVEHCYQFVWLCPWIDQDAMAGRRADQRITVHGPGTNRSHA
jgi:hypothetical protein